jgi:hypothetical protein
MNDKLRDMKMHEPLMPSGRKPFRRTDTGINAVDDFIDTEKLLVVLPRFGWLVVPEGACICLI